jgi:hypothetical protein
MIVEIDPLWTDSALIGRYVSELPPACVKSDLARGVSTALLYGFSGMKAAISKPPDLHFL